MSGGLALGVVLAVISAVALNTSFFLQHRVTSQQPTLMVRHPFAALRILFSNPRWLIANTGGWVGWGLYIVAVRLAPLSVIQAILSAGLPILALLAHRYGATIGPRERLAAFCGLTGLVLVSISLGSHSAGGKANLPIVLCVVIGGFVVAGVVVGLLRNRLQPGAALGCAAGLFYASGDVATKGAVNGTGLILIVLLILASVFGFGAQQLAYQRGAVMQTAGLSSLITAIVPIFAGIAIYHERLPPGAFGWIRAAGFAMSVVSVILLGTGNLPRELDADESSPGTKKHAVLHPDV